MSRSEQYRNELNAHLARIRQFMDQHGPESETFIYWKPSENEWSVMETLCHIEEALLYWSAELKRVVEAGGTDWGRGLDHPGRLQAVAEAGQRKLASVLEGINKAQRVTLDVLSQLEDDHIDLEAPHRNPKFGVKPMRFLIEHFITEHMEIHAKQLERIKGQYDK